MKQGGFLNHLMVKIEFALGNCVGKYSSEMVFMSDGASFMINSLQGLLYSDTSSVPPMRAAQQFIRQNLARTASTRYIT